jgi:DNA-binding phage protein
MADPFIDQFFEIVRRSDERDVRIAERAGCTSQQIGFLRRRSRVPRLDLASRVAEALGYRLELVPINQPKRQPRKRLKQNDQKSIDTRTGPE